MMTKDKFASTPFYVRWSARIVSKWISKSDADSYQCNGKLNWTYESGDCDIQVPKSQLLHWMLRDVGYSVCVADVEEIYKL